jgi:AraC family transcriptional regulator
MKTYMQTIIDYIEDHIEEPISIEEISAHVGYSRFYLHRLFLTYTGYSIMDYVRTRKMQYALCSLKKGEKVIDVALQYGYASERSFRRAFRLVYQASPSIMRTRDFSLPGKIILGEIGGIRMLPYLSEVKTVKLKEYYAIGHQVISQDPEEESISHMRAYRLKKGLDPISEIGSDVPVSSTDSDRGKHGYVQYLVLPEDDFKRVEDDYLIKKRVEASTYIMLRIDDPFNDPFERIPNGFKKLVQYLNAHHAYNDSLSIGSFEEAVTTMHQTYMNIFIAIKS